MEATGTYERVAQQVVCWRYEELVRAGWDQENALELAMEARVDLHLACDLLRSDCPPKLALRIVT